MNDKETLRNKVFLIAGSEPLGAAGMQTDIKCITACGGYAAGALTCIVDEDTTRVKDILMLPVPLVLSQTVSFLDGGLQGELAYYEDVASALQDGAVHHAVFVVEDA